MPTNANETMNTAIDRAFVAKIVRQVIARLRQSNPNPPPTNSTTQNNSTTQTNSTAASIGDKIVTLATIENLRGTPTQLFVTPGSVVTPAAADAARERGMEINKTSAGPPAQQPRPDNSTSNQEIIDRDQPERAESVTAQLVRRGVTTIGRQIVLSDTPAAELHRCISSDACRAAMVTAVADVERFQRELRPDTWVLDMGRMNLISAVNIAARIAHLGSLK